MRFQAGVGAGRVLTVLLLLAGAAGAAPLVWLSVTVSPYGWIAAGIWSAAAVCAAGWYPRRFAAALYGTLDDCAVTVHTGVWWRREIRMPLSALRTFECWTLPFSRLWNCSVVILRFAGGSVWLPLLPVEQARRLTAALSEDSV